MIPVFSSSSPLRERCASGGPGAVGSESAAPCSGQGQALGTRFRGYDEKNGRVPSVKFAPLDLLVFEAAPQPLDEDIVPIAAPGLRRGRLLPSMLIVIA